MDSPSFTEDLNPVLRACEVQKAPPVPLSGEDGELWVAVEVFGLWATCEILPLLPGLLPDSPAINCPV